MNLVTDFEHTQKGGVCKIEKERAREREREDWECIASLLNTDISSLRCLTINGHEEVDKELESIRISLSKCLEPAYLLQLMLHAAFWHSSSRSRE